MRWDSILTEHEVNGADKKSRPEARLEPLTFYKTQTQQWRFPGCSHERASCHDDFIERKWRPTSTLALNLRDRLGNSINRSFVSEWKTLPLWLEQLLCTILPRSSLNVNLAHTVLRNETSSQLVRVSTRPIFGLTYYIFKTISYYILLEPMTIIIC